jgi:cytoskeletal protein CcmA (bactofilin family)
MFRPGKNTKDQTHTADDTADHTPQTSSSYGSPSSSSTTPGATATPTEAYQQQVYTQTTSRAVTESESLARDIKEGTLTGFVGNGTTLTGEASFKGMLRVDGGLSGRVSSADGTLIVSTNGHVDANVEVAVATIYGTVNGDIIASKRIEMGRVAKVTGNIQTPALVIENGAIFEGSCRMVAIKEQSEKLPDSDKKADASTSTTPSTSSTSPSSLANRASASGGSSKTDKPDATDSSTSATGATGTTGTTGTPGTTGTA